MRKEKNVSLRSAAKEIGISRTSLSEHENGLKNPGLKSLRKICNYYNESMDWVINTSNNRFIKDETTSHLPL